MVAYEVKEAPHRRKPQTAFNPAVVPFGNCTGDDKVLAAENEEAHPDVGEIVHKPYELSEGTFLVVAVNDKGSRTFNHEHEIDEEGNSDGCSCDGLQNYLLITKTLKKLSQLFTKTGTAIIDGISASAFDASRNIPITSGIFFLIPKIISVMKIVHIVATHVAAPYAA